MAKNSFKKKITFPNQKGHSFILFGTVFIIVFIGILGTSFLFPVVRLGIHRIAVLSGFFNRGDNYRNDGARDGSVSVPTEEKVFTDVPSDHPQFPAIAGLKKRGFIKGYSDGSFQPEKPLSRAEIVEILIVAKGIKPNSVNFSHCFKDVGQEWYATNVCYAKNKKWISGYPDATFKPFSDVTKAEAQKLFLTVLNVASLPELSEKQSTEKLTRAEFAQWVYHSVAGK